MWFPLGIIIQAHKMKEVVVITGGSRGIGKEIARRFIEQGAIVYSMARTTCDIEGVKSVEVDICKNIADAKKKLMMVSKECGGIDIFINNAGIMEDALIGMISTENIQKQFQMNVFSLIELSQLAARIMKKKKKGAIVNISSIIGTNGNAGQAVYSATKGAVISFTKSAAKELAQDGIRVNAVAPGIIATDLIKNVPDECMKERISKIAMGRPGRPEEVAEAVLFLASDKASYISGQILGVDGCAVI